MRIIASCKESDGSDWTVLGNDTDNLEASANVIFGRYCLDFDKANGSDNTVYAGAYKTVSERLDFGTFLPADEIFWLIQLPTLGNVAFAVVRLGSSTTNYVEWRFAETNLTLARWTLCSARLGNGFVNGTGIDWKNITHVGIGALFDTASDTLENIQAGPIWVDHTVQTG